VQACVSRSSARVNNAGSCRILQLCLDYRGKEFTCSLVQKYVFVFRSNFLISSSTVRRGDTRARVYRITHGAKEESQKDWLLTLLTRASTAHYFRRCGTLLLLPAESGKHLAHSFFFPPSWCSPGGNAACCIPDAGQSGNTTFRAAALATLPTTDQSSSLQV